MARWSARSVPEPATVAGRQVDPLGVLASLAADLCLDEGAGARHALPVPGGDGRGVMGEV